MGCSSPQNAGMPNIPPYHMNRLLQVANINHALNINKKYEHLCRVDTTREVGSGITKTYCWTALATKEQIDQKIKEYWQSRTNGQQQIWKIIEHVVSIQDDDKAINILTESKITLLNGSIQMCLDSRLNKYEVPIFCINAPDKYSEELIEDRNLNYEYDDKTMEISIRSTKYPNGDIKMSEKASTQILVVKDSLRAMKELSSETKIRFFYTGREMKDDKTLGNYNYAPGTVIQAMIL